MQVNDGPGNSLSRILELLTREHPLNREERQIYDLVMMKNFQIIQTLLTKLNGLYHKNEEYEADFVYIRSKLDGMEASIQNLHHEFRTTSSATDKKLSEHSVVITNNNNELEYLRKQVKEEKWRSDFENQQKEIEINNQDILKICKLREQDKKFIQNYIEQNQKNMDAAKAQLQFLKREIQNNKNMFAQPEKSMNKSFCTTLKHVQDMPVEKSRKKITPSNKSKSNTPSVKVLFKNIKEMHSGYDLGKSYMNKQLRQIEQIQKNTAFFEKKVEALSQKMEERFKQMVKQNQDIKTKLSERVINSMRQLRMKASQSSAVAGDQTKSDKQASIDAQQLKKLQSQMHEQIDFVRFTLNEYLVKLEKDLDKKIDRNTFQKGLKESDSHVRSVLIQNQIKFANRSQTRRAINFLEEKLNIIYQKIEQQQCFVPSRKNDENQCLKVYRCELTPSRNQMRKQKLDSVGIIEPFNEMPTEDYIPLTSVKINKQQSPKSNHFKRLHLNKSYDAFAPNFQNFRNLDNAQIHLKKLSRTGSTQNLIKANLDSDTKEWKAQVQKHLSKQSGKFKKYHKKSINGLC